ncbi:hypothetical protein ANCDUO_00101 [Ancylostoma duodenale]|uniref:Unspecific monooxygenase n=1 Tax=Ancylostoma duodenale TaxID=51022 RepID=A0A0C2H6Q2_9BILA|nr:hypothetical protein ANCDUO_00101 [Ancylostoma duodenale]
MLYKRNTCSAHTWIYTLQLPTVWGTLSKTLYWERHLPCFPCHVFPPFVRTFNFSRRSLCFVAADLWTGGMETTVTTMRWALIYMIYHPSVQLRCQKELDKVFGPEPSVYSRKSETPYVMATIAEVQRISNVLPWAIPHRTMNDVFIDGYFIPKGTEIMPQYGCILHDPNLFPNPDQFLPERFLDTDGAYRPRVELKPFGFGARVCLGEFLAKCELYLIFTTLLQKFTFTAIGKRSMQ